MSKFPLYGLARSQWRPQVILTRIDRETPLLYFGFAWERDMRDGGKFKFLEARKETRWSKDNFLVVIEDFDTAHRRWVKANELVEVYEQKIKASEAHTRFLREERSGEMLRIARGLQEMPSPG